MTITREVINMLQLLIIKYLSTSLLNKNLLKLDSKTSLRMTILFGELKIFQSTVIIR